MESSLRDFWEIPEDSRWMQEKLDDRRIRCGKRLSSPDFEVWYFPDNSPPYRICRSANRQEAFWTIRKTEYLSRKEALQKIHELDEAVKKKQISITDYAYREMRQALRNRLARKVWITG